MNSISLPENWKILKFKDCITQLCTGLNPRDNFSLGHGTIKYITAKNLIGRGEIDFSTCDYIDEEAKRTINKRSNISVGDILFSSRAPIGQTYLIKTEPDDFEIGESIFSIKANTNVLTPEYLCLYLSSDYFIKSASMHVTGSVIQEIRVGNLMETDIIVPPFKEQIMITNCISSIDDKIRTNCRICSVLEQIAKTIYDYWFLQFEFPNEEGKPYKSSGGKVIWCEELKREIPEGWEVIAFNTIGEFFKGKIPSKELTLSPTGDSVSPYVTIDVANNASPLYCNPERMTPLNGETIMVMDGAASGDVYVGNKGTLGSTFSKITSLREDISDPLIYMLLKEHSVIYKKANTGSTVPHANPSFIKQMKFALPKKCERMSHALNVIFDQITNCRKQNQELESFRNFLLPMLMNGQVTFKDKYRTITYM